MWLEGRFYLEFLRLIRDPVFRGDDVPSGLRRPVLLIPGFLAGDWTLRTQFDWLKRVGYRPRLAGVAFNVSVNAVDNFWNIVSTNDSVTITASDVNATLPAATREFYVRAMRRLDEAGVEFLVGGAYAFERYTGIARHTKDFDIFVHPRDVERVLATLSASGCETELPFPHWLGKARCGEDFVDVIFSSGNGVAAVDDDWFKHSVEEEVFGRAVRLIPAEEMIWSKAFIMERERFDGGDVAHILRASAERIDWMRLVARFGDYWRVLMAHLVLFGFIYPGERHRIPPGILSELSARLQRELATPEPGERVCRGTILSRAQYIVDVERWGYGDPRLAPQGNMTEREAEIWTAGIADDGPADALEAA